MEGPTLLLRPRCSIESVRTLGHPPPSLSISRLVIGHAHDTRVRGNLWERESAIVSVRSPAPWSLVPFCFPIAVSSSHSSFFLSPHARTRRGAELAGHVRHDSENRVRTLLVVYYWHARTGWGRRKRRKEEKEAISRLPASCQCPPLDAQ